MKKILYAYIFAFCFMLCIGITSIAAPGDGYELMFRDDFNGSTLNADLWSIRGGAPYGGQNLVENVRVTNGKLYLDYTKTNGIYSGGGILTNMPLPYGYYETKSKAYTGAKGFHTSFWLCGGNSFITKPAYYPDNNQLLELDGYEIDSNESTTTAPKPAYNNHYWWGDHKSFGGGKFNIETDGNNATLDEFTMGIEWLPGKVIYYANGKEVGRSEDLKVYGPSYLWLTAVAVPAWHTSIDDSKMDANGYFGSSTYEYVSYAQKKLKGVNLLGNGHFEYNRTALSAKPRAFDSENAIAVSTLSTYDGMCCAQISAMGKIEQQLPFLLEGKYGFEGYFRTQKETVAQVYIHDKHGNVLSSKSIPSNANWVKVSIPDISVTDSAFISIECTKGILMTDNLSLFCQEGDDSYIDYRDDDYENYSLIKNSNGTEYSAEETLRNGSWTASTLNSVKNLWMQVYNPEDNMSPLYTDTYATWNIPMKESGVYTIQLYQIQYINNVHTQDYTISVDGIPVDTVTVQTQNDTPKYGWISLKTVNVKAGQTLSVNMTPCAPKDDAVCARITPIRILNQEETILQNAFIAQINSAVYFNNTAPGVFDSENTKITPYIDGKKLFLPRAALEKEFNVKFPGNTEYILKETVESALNRTVTLYSDFIFIHKDAYIINDACIQSVLPYFYKIFVDPFLHTNSNAKFFGTTDVTNQELHNYDTARLIGSWGKSGLGYMSESRYTNNTNDYAAWTISPKATKRYSIQFYSPVHNGASNNTPSTKKAHVILHIPVKDTHTFTFDQCDGQDGWYHLAHLDLTPEDKIYIYLSNGSSGTLRASAVRLIPSDTSAVLVGDFDETVQEKYEFSAAETFGNWLTSGIGTNSYYAQQNASAKWKISPEKSQKYAVQIYIPTTTSNNNTTQQANIQLTVDHSPYYYTIDERRDTTAHTGWYDLGLFDLKQASDVELEISNRASGFLRAGSVRLVPYPNKPYATKSENVVTLYAGTLSRYQNAFLFAEYDGNGKLVNVTNLPALPKQTIMLNNDNAFKCFFWEENGTFSPITQYVE